jgi:predicted ArsR family transcriptional regulator
MPGNPVKLTDPRQMRALAHPARVTILLHLALEGPATATECATVAEMSPSACSYHLRTLARYGFIEMDPSAAADGRERPWRAKVISMEFPDGADTPPAIRAASRVVADTFRASADELRERFEDQKEQYPAEWQEALGLYHDSVHVTAQELTELREQLMELFAPYRRLDRAERPAGGRRLIVPIDFVPWSGPGESQ